MHIKEISDIFKNNCNYSVINKNNNKKMRNSKIKLLDVLSYRYLYSHPQSSKNSNTSLLSFTNKTSFSRQAYDAKEANIPLAIYSNIFNDLSSYYNQLYVDRNKLRLLAVDGTYNRDSNFNEVLNLGVFDCTNSIPVRLESFGQECKNKEVSSLINLISNDPSIFTSSILVGDRCYFTYKLIRFLITNKIKFIIRVKGDGTHISDKTKNIKSNNNYNNINFIRNKVRIIKCESTFMKTVYMSNNFKHKRNVNKSDKHVLTIKNDCTLITNLGRITYDDDTCLNLYKSRWDIETFFGFIKKNYKFSVMKESKKISCLKNYYCTITIDIIIKILIKNFTKTQTKSLINHKANYTNIVKGFFQFMLIDLITDCTTEANLLQFCKSYIHYNKIVKNRSYPRVSKTPFSKWYIKKYSILTDNFKIIKAIMTNAIDKLNKNLKSKANQIIKIDNKNCCDYIT